MADKKRTILSDYYELIVKYKGLAEAAQKELEECRNEMRQMKADIINRVNDGQYLWDDKRIVISAPEIVIGNVNKNGEFKGGGRVVIVGNAVNLNGVGPAGSVVTKAPAIFQMAVNPGGRVTVTNKCRWIWCYVLASFRLQRHHIHLRHGSGYFCQSDEREEEKRTERLQNNADEFEATIRTKPQSAHGQYAHHQGCH